MSAETNVHAEVYQYLTLTGGFVFPYDFRYLSPVTRDKVWVSDIRNNLFVKKHR